MAIANQTRKDKCGSKGMKRIIELAKRRQRLVIKPKGKQLVGYISHQLQKLHLQTQQLAPQMQLNKRKNQK